jgi:prolyl-tRNA synthetase
MNLTALGSKEAVKIDELAEGVAKILEKIQQALFDKAKKSYDDNRSILTDWNAIVPALNAKKITILPHCLGQLRPLLKKYVLMLIRR